MRMYNIHWILSCIIILIGVHKSIAQEKLSSDSSIRAEYRLLQDLLRYYDPAARPLLNLSEVMKVRMGVALFQIRDIDEKNQFLQLNAWFQFHWTDPHLSWNASKYSDIQRLRIPSDRVWVPDIVLYNSVDETKPTTEIFSVTNCIVSHNGNVMWVVPAMIKSSCQIDITYFPFDEQRCPLKFGSWTYDGFQLDLVNLKEKGDLSKFITNGEWTLLDMPGQRNEEYYSCCAEPYVDVTYTIIIRRKPMFFTYNLVFPCALLIGIGILVFCLPPESGEKVSLGVTVLLAMTVYQLLIADAIPPTSEVVPLIGKFFGAAIALLSMSSAMTVVVMKMHFSGEHGSKVPKWLRCLVSFLAKIVCLGWPIKERSQKGEHLYNYSNDDEKFKEALKTSQKESNLINNLFDEFAALTWRRRARHVLDTDNMHDVNVVGIEVSLLTYIKQLVQCIYHRDRKRDKQDYCKSEWRMVAMVLDRVLLITFFVMTVFTCAAIFMNVPK